MNAGDTAEGGSFQFYVYSVSLRLVSETEPGEYDYGLSQGSPPATARGDEATISIEWGDGVTPPEEAEYSWHSSAGTAVLNGSGELAREWSGSMAEMTTITAEVSFHQQAVPNFLEQTYVGEVPVKHRDVNWMFTLDALVEHTPIPETLPIPGPINGSSVSMTEIGTDNAISAHDLADFYTELHGSLNLPSHDTESALIVAAAGKLHRLRHDPCTTSDGLLGVYGEGLYPSVGFQYNYLRVVENLTFEPCTVDGPNGGLLYTNEPTGDWPVEIATNLNLYVPGSAYYNSTTPALMALEATRVEEHERLHHTFWQMGIQLQAADRATNIFAEPEFMEHWYSEYPMLALESLVISDSDLQSSDIGKAAAFSLAQLEAVSRMRAGFWGSANGGIWYRAGEHAIEAWPDHGGEDNASGARCP